MQAHIEAWKTSGLTQVQYCQQNNIKSHIFTYYKSKLTAGQTKEVRSGLLPVQIISERNQTLYSLIETAKANKLEPYSYLRYILTELPKLGRHAEQEDIV